MVAAVRDNRPLADTPSQGHTQQEARVQGNIYFILCLLHVTLQHDVVSLGGIHGKCNIARNLAGDKRWCCTPLTPA